jgi:serine/threonine protein kinase
VIGVGTRLRDYEIVAPLRVGGMATLYLGRRQGAAGFAKLVAVKVVHPHLAREAQFGQMFVDEALISARIEHPNVVHVTELGQQDGAYFLVMEYVHGAALSQLLAGLAKRGRRLSPELAVHIAVRVAEGLHAAHETLGDDGQPLHVVHRDISPQNVLLSARGHVKLIDFGIAKARGRVQQTTTTSLKGKIRYMAPEQAYGRPVDRRTDVYALAVVLWEMLTMRRMFTADNDFALLDMVRSPSPPPPSTYLQGCTPELDAAVMHALQPDLASRTPTASEFRRELAAAMPSALALDASNLGELLASVLGAELDEERKTITAALQGAGSAELPAARATAPETIDQYTVSDGQIRLLPPEQTVIQEEAPPPVPSAVPVLGPATHTATPTPVVVPTAPPSSVPRILAAAALLVALGGGGAYAAIRLTAPDETAAIGDAHTAAPAPPPPALVEPAPVPPPVVVPVVAQPALTPDAGTPVELVAPVEPAGAPTQRRTKTRRPAAQATGSAGSGPSFGVPMAGSFDD